MKRDFILLSLSLAVLISVFYVFQQNQIAKESITYFPIDPTVSFPKAETSIQLQNQKYDEYSIEWETTSNLNKRAYLRQNMSLLYANGKLVSKMGEWKQNTMELSERKTVVEKESKKFEAISFHYAEIHDKNERIFSSQKITDDFLYVVNSKYDNQAKAFRNAKNQDETKWKKLLDSQTKEYLYYYFNQSIKKNQLSLEQYPLRLLLTDLEKFNEEPLKGFTKQQTAKIIGQLMEGLYKNYFLGIRTADGDIIDPIGSTIPIILIAKDHLLVEFTTKNGESIILRQQISTL
ncbi:hypothetical protein [Niallia nealsonii]|uniref:Uncharacterized protein n=1 Tax=Niallia nealsonii TaxID=115979 RepID=A0A2N0Z895_9BACI|nr:hypothetical protein [Niallia nealsonii]PKG25728.1 hypothetical protein CWS01_00420 [Niallia nealsonii]